MQPILRSFYGTAAIVLFFAYILILLDAVSLSRAIFLRDVSGQHIDVFSKTPIGKAITFNIGAAFDDTVASREIEGTEYSRGYGRYILIIVQPVDNEHHRFEFRLISENMQHNIERARDQIHNFIEIDRYRAEMPVLFKEDCGLRNTSNKTTLFSMYFPLLSLESKCELFQSGSFAATLNGLANRLRLTEEKISVRLFNINQAYYIYISADGSVSSNMNGFAFNYIPDELVKQLDTDGKRCWDFGTCKTRHMGNLRVLHCSEISLPIDKHSRVDSTFLASENYCLEANMDNLVVGSKLRFYLTKTFSDWSFDIGVPGGDLRNFEHALQHAWLLDGDTLVQFSPEIGIIQTTLAVFFGGLHSKKIEISKLNFDLLAGGIFLTALAALDLIIGQRSKHAMQSETKLGANEPGVGTAKNGDAVATTNSPNHTSQS